MLWIVLGLLGWGIGDLVAATAPRRRRLALVAGPAAMLIAFLLAGYTGVPSLLVWVAFGGAHFAWRRVTDENPAVAPEESDGEGQPGARPRPREARLVPALACLAAPVALALLLAGAAPALGGLLARWAAWVAVPPAEVQRALIIGTAALVQCATANILVRLLLVQVAVPVKNGTNTFAAEGTFKGGRFIGPMERILLLLMGLAGQLAAGTLITAAKGLLRIPELKQAKDDTSGAEGREHEATTEYVLVGTLASWLIAIVTFVAIR